MTAPVNYVVSLTLSDKTLSDNDNDSTYVVSLTPSDNDNDSICQQCC